MQVFYNDTSFIFPTSLVEITIRQKSDFQKQHGEILDQMHLSIMSMEDGPEKEIEDGAFFREQCFRNFSFYSGIDLDVLKASNSGDAIISIAAANAVVSVEEEKELYLNLNLSFEWNGEIWEIHPPELKQGSLTTTGEFVDSKQIIKDMLELGRGHWDRLIPLAAIYFRKKGEAYQESFMYEDSERLKLMENLPMNMALTVGFFLIGSMIFSLSILRYSIQEKANQADLPSCISIDTDGSISLRQLQKPKSSTFQTVARIQ